VAVQNVTTPPDFVIAEALRESTHSPCQSKRGAAIFELVDGRWAQLHGLGHNAPPEGFLCDASDACKQVCRRTAIHAEQMAIARGWQVRGCDLVHVKAVDCVLVDSGPPSCVECSKLAILFGLVHVWLFEASGWHRYPVREFHLRSVFNAAAKLGAEAVK